MADPNVPEQPLFTARGKFSCPVCGGEAQWNPAKQALICTYCGTESPAKIDVNTGDIQEHDLAAALRNIPDSDRGWQRETRSVQCQSCKAISVFPAERVAQRCEFCGSSALVPYEQAKPPISPESLLPFKFSESNARDAVRKWYGSVWFAPDRLKKAALTDTVKGMYLPYWTFDARAHCNWQAEAGYYYYTTVSYTDTDGQEKTREERNVRWEFASGEIDHFFDDELVPASKGVTPKLLRAVEPFPTTSDLVKYDPGFLSGWVVEQYQIDLIAAAQNARNQMTSELEQLCSAEVPGDTQRNLQIAPAFSADTYKHILLPIWLLSYSYGGRAWQVVINGYDGKLAGEYPKSWVKITILVLAILMVILIIVALGGKH